MSRTVRIFLDGNLVEDKDVSGIEDARITIDQSNSEGAQGVAFGSEFSFSGAAYSYILSRLVDSPTAAQNSVLIRVELTCCTNPDGSPLSPFSGIISRKEISFCEKGLDTCTVQASALENSTVSQKLQCLRNTIIHAQRIGSGRRISDGEDEGRPARFLAYYEETRPYSYAYLTLFFAVYLLYITIIFRIILAAITALTFGLVPFTDGSAFILNAFLKKRYHKTPFVSSYLANACKLCGLNLDAPLFQAGGAYYNLMRLDAPYQEGGKNRLDALIVWQKFNRPNITFAELLGSFKELNLGYLVTDTTLIFDRIDRIQDRLWIDFSTGERLIYEQCYEADDVVQPAFEVFEYAQDGSDKLGNEAVRVWASEVVDYNTPINPILSGARRTTIQYGAARFIQDGQRCAIEDVTSSTFYAIATFGQNSIDKKAMIMSAGTCSSPKLLVWDGVSPVSNGHVLRQGVGGGAYAYSLPSWLNQNTRNEYGVAGFYENLLTVSDPRLNLKKGFAFRIRFRYLCSDLQNIALGKFVRLQRGTQVVRGDVQSIEIDLNNGEITVTGVI
jgi:hypothetical protein